MVLFVVHAYCHTLIVVLRMILSKVLVLLVLMFSCHGIVIYIVVSHILLGMASWRLLNISLGYNDVLLTAHIPLGGLHFIMHVGKYAFMSYHYA